ncbi:hypothetical protein GCM10023321_84970 [Pseudonocardia eucalypti]|uniref:Uncharacterized protein n=1 Tax=Pseudonocardia eucalypti TaxID=648755 RepID=A0ABP9RF11_9PSEU
MTAVPVVRPGMPGPVSVPPGVPVPVPRRSMGQHGHGPRVRCGVRRRAGGLCARRARRLTGRRALGHRRAGDDRLAGRGASARHRRQGLRRTRMRAGEGECR